MITLCDPPMYSHISKKKILFISIDEKKEVIFLHIGWHTSGPLENNYN